MKRLTFVLLAALLAVSLAGCGNDKEKGINKDRDMPRAAEK
jgi:predicted small lipoprotein YifL